MSLGAPTSAQEYLARFSANQKITGHGIGNVYIHMPCPFCAAPEFIVYELLEVEEAMAKGAECRECGRAARAVFTRSPSSVSFEIMQTGGPDQPEWLTPKMRRMS